MLNSKLVVARHQVIGDVNKAVIEYSSLNIVCICDILSGFSISSCTKLTGSEIHESQSVW